MKKIFTLVLLFSVLVGIGQEQFSFTLYLEDAAGNQDSLVIGYDSLATDSIDIGFGEVNLLQTPWNLPFDARVGNRDPQWGYGDSSEWVTDKSIVPYNGGVKIDVKCSNYPLQIFWDISQFPIGSDVEWSHMVYPNVIDKYDFLRFYGSLTIGEFEMDEYQNYHGDTIRYFYFQFCDDQCSYLSVNEKSDEVLKVFPNPTSDYLTLIGVKEVNDIMVFDVMGKQCKVSKTSKNQLDISVLPTGYYRVVIDEKSYPFIINR